MNPIQNPLFKEPVGASFRSKREALGMSIDEAAKNMKFGTHLVQAMENEQWDVLGPAIFAKSYISSYIKLLGMDESIKNEIPTLSSGTPALKTITQTRVEPAGIQSKSILAMVSLLGLAALIAFLYNRKPAVDTTTVDSSIPLSAPVSVNVPAPVILNPENAVSPPVNTASNELPLSQPQAIALNKPVLLIRTKQETWLEIRDINNTVLFSELIPANQERTQSLEKIGKITLGNASTVELLINNGIQNIAAFIKNDDVARFTIDANGAVAAITP
jgi:cytoskeleton protein RodZ